ncbi:MAG TPA: PepSY domain-containing protein [Burkholderiales bacterium]|nr:PepSY domain-containing protein [Burkholderiales bacterium]
MRTRCNHSLLAAALTAGAILASPTHATGLATCDSGPREGWQPQSVLEKRLTEQKWQVRRIKVDGGCYEVYAMNEKGERVEAYFHPVTLAPVPTGKK